MDRQPTCPSLLIIQYRSRPASSASPTSPIPSDTTRSPGLSLTAPPHDPTPQDEPGLGRLAMAMRRWLMRDMHPPTSQPHLCRHVCTTPCVIQSAQCRAVDTRVPGQVLPDAVAMHELTSGRLVRVPIPIGIWGPLFPNPQGKKKTPH